MKFDVRFPLKFVDLFNMRLKPDNYDGHCTEIVCADLKRISNFYRRKTFEYELL